MKKILDFRKKVQEVHEKGTENINGLKKEIEILSNQNLKIGEETKNLTSALKGDSKIQGDWGELILEKYLQNAGLIENENYFVQQSITNEIGKRLRSDIIVSLPNESKVVIDSKVSLTDYERYTSSDDDAEKEKYALAHIQSIRKHIQELDKKNYQTAFEKQGSLNFVLMFVPIEPALLFAISKDQDLVNYAFKKDVVLVNASTLLLSLRLINNLWNREKQDQNAIDIATKAGSLYEKFVGFLNDYNEIGKKISDAESIYHKGLNKLTSGKGNLIKRAEDLKKLGAKTTKDIPNNYIEILEHEPSEDMN